MSWKLLQVGVASVVLVSGGCDKDSKSSKKESSKKGSPEKSEKEGTGGDKLTLTLKSRGAEPQRKLRYRVPAGHKQSAVMVMEMSMAMEMGARKVPKRNLPTVRMHITVENRSVDDRGRMHMAFKLEKVEIAETRGFPPAGIQQMKSSLAQIVGLGGSMRVSSRGVTDQVKVEVPEPFPPQARQIVDSLQQQLHQLVPPLPERSVGVGATWEVRMPLRLPQFVAYQTSRFELMKVSDAGFKAEVSSTQTAPPAVIHPPGMPPGSEASIDFMKGKAKGWFEARYDRAIARARASSQVNMAMTIKAQGQTQRMTMEMGIDMEVRPE